MLVLVLQKSISQLGHRIQASHQKSPGKLFRDYCPLRSQFRKWNTGRILFANLAR